MMIQIDFCYLSTVPATNNATEQQHHQGKKELSNNGMFLPTSSSGKSLVLARGMWIISEEDEETDYSCDFGNLAGKLEPDLQKKKEQQQQNMKQETSIHDQNKEDNNTIPTQKVTVERPSLDGNENIHIDTTGPRKLEIIQTAPITTTNVVVFCPAEEKQHDQVRREWPEHVYCKIRRNGDDDDQSDCSISTLGSLASLTIRKGGHKDWFWRHSNAPATPTTSATGFKTSSITGCWDNSLIIEIK